MINLVSGDSGQTISHCGQLIGQLNVSTRCATTRKPTGRHALAAADPLRVQRMQRCDDVLGWARGGNSLYALQYRSRESLQT